MRLIESRFWVLMLTVSAVSLATACGGATGNTNLSTVNTNTGISNSVVNSNLNTSGSAGSIVETREPDQYQAMVKLSLEPIGGDKKATLPAIGAKVARSTGDRVMEFTMPNNEKVIFLDKGGVNYLILPGRKQYAELTKESIGFDVRRMLMPEQIVTQIKAIPGVKLAGEETMNGRQVTKYTYQSTANTQTTAGTVGTESYMIVDKETGLPLRTETVTQSQSGGNVQGMSGVRVVTEMTDIKTAVEPAMFALPTDFQKIDAETVKTQVSMIFQVVGTFIGQAMNSNQQRPAATANSNTNTNAAVNSAPVR